MANTVTSKQIAFENYERSEKVQGSSERAFGLVFTAFFTLIAFIKYWPSLKAIFTPNLLTVLNKGLPFEKLSWNFNLLDYPWIIAASLSLILSLFCPAMLKPFNWIWMRFGLILHRIMNPIVMGLLFYGVLTPTGLIMRLFHCDPLRLHGSKNVSSYWIQRETRNPSHLKNQF